MSLRIVFDSDADRLAERFVDAMAPGGQGPALAVDSLLVPTLGVGAWLKRRVAGRYGISALLEVTLGGRFIWAALERMIGGLAPRSPFEAAKARWAVLALFDMLPADPALDALGARLALLDDRERFALAGSIAQLFDRYLAFRRDWLEAWGQGRSVAPADEGFAHEAWQRWLWVNLLERLPDVSARHPFDRFRDALHAARGMDAAQRAAWGARLAPGRIFVFGALSVSPEQFRLLAEFGRIRDVVWFAPDPSRDFWEHVLSPGEAARIARDDPSQAWLYESEPAILGAWGKAQRDFLAQLRLLEGDVGVEVDESFRDAPIEPPGSALAALRSSVQLLDDSPWSSIASAHGDDSIEIHATHGDIRQAEVLHDRLLDCFARMPDLEPADVVVYCSSLSRMAPAIEAVFDAAPHPRRLPFRIADRADAGEPAVRAVVQMLAVARGPRHVGAVLELLGNAAVRDASGLDESSFERLARWLEAAGVHRDEEREPEAAKHGWQAGLERLMLGVLGSDAVVEAGSRSRVGGPGFGDSPALDRLLEILDDARALAAAPARRPIGDWVASVSEWCARHLVSGPAVEPGLAKVRDAGARLASSAHAIAGPVSLATFSEALATELAESAAPARPGGSITVCGLGALPGVPFRVTALVGMEEAAWPRDIPPQEFDLMRVRPRFGDRLTRFDDRGATLDAVLATRDRLLVFYTGRDARDDSVLNPSQQVRELLDYLARVHPPSARVRYHPLQPFGRRAFEREASERSFAAEWLPAARAVLEPVDRRPGLSPVAIVGPAVSGPSEPRAGVAIGALIDELASPAAAFARHTLRIGRPDGALMFDDRAPVDPARIDAARLAPLLAEVWSGRCALSDIGRRLADVPWSPPGVGGTMLVERARALVGAALDKRRSVLEGLGLAESPAQSVQVEHIVDGTAIGARLDDIHDGRVQFVVTPFPRHARSAIEAWLRHALWLAGTGGDDGERTTIWLALEHAQAWSVREVRLQGGAAAALAHALHWSGRARREPVPLFPRPLFKALEKPGVRSGAPVRVDWEAAARAFRDAYLRGGAWGASAAAIAANEALWRAGLPDPGVAFDATREAYGPVFQALVPVAGTGRAGT